MRMLKTMLLLFAALFVSSTAHCGDVQQLRAKRSLSDLSRGLADGKIDQIQIEAIPFAANFDPEVTGESLDNAPYYRCKIEKDRAEFKMVTRLLADTRVTGSHVKPFVRWGLIFFDHSGRRLSAIYTGEDFAERSFVDANIDGNAVAINKLLIDWLVKHVPFAGCTKASG
jgi:hypothetical protein